MHIAHKCNFIFAQVLHFKCFFRQKMRYLRLKFPFCGADKIKIESKICSLYQNYFGNLQSVGKLQLLFTQWHLCYGD